jgi:hypothetical protein
MYLHYPSYGSAYVRCICIRAVVSVNIPNTQSFDLSIHSSSVLYVHMGCLLKRRHECRMLTYIYTYTYAGLSIQRSARRRIQRTHETDTHTATYLCIYYDGSSIASIYMVYPSVLYYLQPPREHICAWYAKSRREAKRQHTLRAARGHQSHHRHHTHPSATTPNPAEIDVFLGQAHQFMGWEKEAKRV